MGEVRKKSGNNAGSRQPDGKSIRSGRQADGKSIRSGREGAGVYLDVPTISTTVTTLAISFLGLPVF